VSGCIALIRGINVGRGNRVSMSDLRDLFSDLVHTKVRTLLNSGNILFQTRRVSVAKLSSEIEAAISAKCGFSAPVTVITAKDLGRIIDENPLLKLVSDHSRHLVAFVARPKVLIVAFSRKAGASVTRNWATVLKLQAAAQEMSKTP
jgi:uncharacterized protein (DUF1697 family)